MEENLPILPSGEGFPLMSACAHCSMTLLVDNYMASFVIHNITYTVADAVDMLYKPNCTISLAVISSLEPLHRPSTNLKLCLDCGAKFAKLLELYILYARTATCGSYMDSLICRIKCEIKNEIAEYEVNESQPPSPISMAPYPISLVPSPISMVPSPISIAPSPNSMAPFPVIVAAYPISRAPIPIQEIPTQPQRSKRKNPHSTTTYGATSEPDATQFCLGLAHDTKSQDGTGIENIEDTQNTVELNPAPNVTKRKPAALRVRPERPPLPSVSEEGSKSELPYYCTECNRGYKEIGLLRRHNQVSHRHKLVRPRYKPTGFSTEDLSLLKTPAYKCDECKDLSFPTLKEWVIHHRDIHKRDMHYKDIDGQDELKPLHKFYRPCPRCGMKLKSNTRVLLHIKGVHLNLREHVCTICGKGFQTKIFLQNHMDIAHVDPDLVPKFMCTQCGKSLSNTKSLLLHERMHEDPSQSWKKFRCTICRKMLTTEENLERHRIKQHSGNSVGTPFICEECGKVFSSKYRLTRHCKEIHLEKTEICSFCGKTYGLKMRLKEHLMTIHKLDAEEARNAAKMQKSTVRNPPPKKPSPTCGICGKIYGRRRQLCAHLISVHKKSEEEAREITQCKTVRKKGPGSRTRKKQNSHKVKA